VDDGLDVEALGEHVAAQLPPYARPLFLRLQGRPRVTMTFKQKKVELVREGFDPTTICEPLFFNDPETGRFLPLDSALYERIRAGKIRL
jgi:fatty-acyl-CoA synthase